MCDGMAAYGGNSGGSFENSEDAWVAPVSVAVGVVILIVIAVFLKNPKLCKERCGKKAKFHEGDWVSVRRDGNRINRKYLGQVTAVERYSTGVAESGETKYRYKVDFHDPDSTKPKRKGDDVEQVSRVESLQAEEWMSLADAPPAATLAAP